jgi:hypothetical protein
MTFGAERKDRVAEIARKPWFDPGCLRDAALPLTKSVDPMAGF